MEALERIKDKVQNFLQENTKLTVAVCAILLSFAAIAFVMGLIVNFILSKLLVFTTGAKVKNTMLEFLSYTVIGIIGLGLTEAIIWLGTVPLHIPVLIAKIIAAVLVLIWNFAARKIFLYGGKT